MAEVEEDGPVEVTLVLHGGRVGEELGNMALLEVGSEIWVAEGLAPRVARIDATTGEALGNIMVGPWPTSLAHSETLGLVLVTQAGNDTLGLVDVDSRQLVDVIWVGDEPSVVVIDDVNATAYVTLETEDAVAVIDLEAREVTGRLPAPLGPRALALSDDGSTLYVAGHRTGQPDRYPYAEAEWDTTDLMAIDVATGDIEWMVEEVGTIITDITKSLFGRLMGPPSGRPGRDPVCRRL